METPYRDSNLRLEAAVAEAAGVLEQRSTLLRHFESIDDAVAVEAIREVLEKRVAVAVSALTAELRAQGYPSFFRQADADEERRARDDREELVDQLRSTANQTGMRAVLVLRSGEELVARPARKIGR